MPLTDRELRRNWWNMHPPEPVKPSVGDLRACGCVLDVTVFGHDRHFHHDEQETPS
jgi:hypothetical protein